jgi:hypothetical protein
MDSEIIIEIVIQALKEINSPRFYKTERGFQGRFACGLYKILEERHIFPDDYEIEEEYQKRLKDHGTRLRPDLIIHIPFVTGRAESRREDNFVVYAFKLRANEAEANEDFEKLDELFEKLDYPIGFFINIGRYPNIFLENYSGRFMERIHELSNKIEEGRLYIRHAYFKNRELVTEEV